MAQKRLRLRDSYRIFMSDSVALVPGTQITHRFHRVLVALIVPFKP